MKPTLYSSLAGVTLAASLLAAQPAKGAVVSYTPDQQGTVGAPIVGLGADSSNYLLTNETATATLPLGFTGNGQEGFAFANPTTTQDAASFDDTYMFQLSTGDGLRKVAISDGTQTPFNGNNSLNVGADSFGIGYDAGTNDIGIGTFDGANMKFRTYDIDTNTLSDLITFAFDSSTYGTPTGLDYDNGRMVVSTRDGPGIDEFSANRNFILDINANTGSIDQYATVAGGSSKLQDVLYDDGRLATSFQSGGSGNVRVGDFTTIPEPASLALLGLGGLCMLGRGRKYE